MGQSSCGGNQGKAAPLRERLIFPLMRAKQTMANDAKSGIFDKELVFERKIDLISGTLVSPPAAASRASSARWRAGMPAVFTYVSRNRFCSSVKLSSWIT